MDRENEPESDFFVVGLGASAGGLRSLEEFFENIPVDSGAAFVVVQHLSPNYKSMMDELLGRHTTMAIQLADDAMAMAPNSVYLIPPGKNLVVRDRTLYLLAQPRYKGHGPPNFPIDIFFETLAEDCQSRSIGIVLSGTGSDGSRGLTAIHEQGGITMVQDPETAEFNGMPHSALSTSVVDRMLAPRNLARSIYHLIQLSSRMPPQQALNLGDRLDKSVAADNLQRITQILASGNQIDFSNYRPSTLSRRIQRRCLVVGFSDLDAYIQYLETSTEEQAILRDEFLINVTRFFRNPDAWAYLETEVIPRIFQQAQPGQPLRFWVTACSTGEEAYSLAILLDEAQRRLNQPLPLKIFATDIDEAALERAAQGFYPKSIARDMSTERLQRYFHAQEQGYRVAQSLRQLLIFSKQNLVQDAGFTRMHLVSCRNVLIYLQPSLQQQVLKMLHFALQIKGVLFLGESETTGVLEAEFNPLNRKWQIYEKLRDVRLSRRATRLDPLRSQSLFQGTQPSRRDQTAQFTPLLSEAIKQVLAHHQITCCLVDHNHTVRHVVADPLKLLQVPTGKLTNHVVKMVPEALQIPLTTALHRAAQSQKTAEYKDITLRLAEQTQQIRVRVTFYRRKTQEYVLIVELQAQSSNSITQGASLADNDTTDQVMGLENELYLTRQSLQTTIEELETTNEEQQASNEELIAANEELQSTNEELQSVNEELHTLNTEYQLKNQQLSELNADLDNLLQNTQIGVVFLDADLNIRRFTQAIKSVINILDADIGRRLSDLSWKVDCSDLNDLVLQVSRQGELVEREIKMPDTGQYFLMSIHPYRLETGINDGIVITFVDIARLK